MKTKAILIADDEPFNLFALSAVLESYGINESLIETANNGKECLDKVKNK